MIKLPEEIDTYNSIESVDINKDETDHIPQEFLRFQTLSKLSSSNLNLKVRAFIILPRNLYPASGEFNKTQMIIT